MKFIHFGGLGSLKQDHYDASSESFHNPPMKKGLYACPEKYIETFLISSTMEVGHISNKSSWLKDDSGNMIASKEGDYNDDGKLINKEILNILKKQNIPQKYVSNQRKDDLKLRKFWKDNNCNDTECEECKVEKECDTLKNTPFYYTYLKKPKIFEYKGEIWHHLVDDVKPHQIIESKKSWIKTSFSDYLEALNKDRHKILKELHKGNFKSELLLRNDPYIKSPSITYCKDHLEVFIEKI